MLLLIFLAFARLASPLPAPHDLRTDISIHITNDLLESGSSKANTGMLLLDNRSFTSARADCSALSETLWGGIDGNSSLIQKNLDYLVYEGTYRRGQLFWISDDKNGKRRALTTSGAVVYPSPNERLPTICTNSAPYSTKGSSNATTPWQVVVHSNNDHVTGFRDRLAFRFLGVRFAPQPERFGYSKLYEGQNSNVTALKYLPECARPSGTGSEDCLYSNIWTPYLPANGKEAKRTLKPVMFWIHGGALTGGTPNDPLYDGSNIASRGDVVLVAINYRLGTLGFLALDDGVTNGNYGLQDTITALEWVQKNIQDFGGDPKRVTIFGQSAGAALVRALLASKKAEGLFAAAIMMSNLGGTNYGKTYSEYYSIGEQVELYSNSLLNVTGCKNKESQLECLRALPFAPIAASTPASRYLVVDGTYLKTKHLLLNNSAPVARVPLMIGTTRDDGAAMVTWQDTQNATEAFVRDGFPISTLESGLFPGPVTQNRTLDIFNITAHVSSDTQFRCVDQATAYAGVKNKIFPEVYYYEFNRTYQLSTYEPNPPVCDAPISAEHPFGDPNAEYFKCHSGELYYVFGNLIRQNRPFRDEYDLPFEQFILDTWSSFARTFNPNPDCEFLRARGYENTAAEIRSTGEWKPVTSNNPSFKRLEWPSRQASFGELAQCQELKLPLNLFI